MGPAATRHARPRPPRDHAGRELSPVRRTSSDAQSARLNGLWSINAGGRTTASSHGPAGGRSGRTCCIKTRPGHSLSHLPKCGSVLPPRRHRIVPSSFRFASVDRDEGHLVRKATSEQMIDATVPGVHRTASFPPLGSIDRSPKRGFQNILGCPAVQRWSLHRWRRRRGRPRRPRSAIARGAPDVGGA
jgi:hypothetical protein